MSREALKIEYRFENDNMTDEEYMNQEEMEFIVTYDMLHELMEREVKLEGGNSICTENFYVTKL